MPRPKLAHPAVARGRPTAAKASLADRVYDELRTMAITFDLRPGERIGEVELAERFGVSRTPVRQALHRLAEEGLLTYTANRGFASRPLDPKEVFDLYETRLAIESAIIGLVVERAAEADLISLQTFLDRSRAVSEQSPTEDLVTLDERFHTQLASLSGNGEMAQILGNINARIRFVRWIDMGNRRCVTQRQHQDLVDAITARDANRGQAVIRAHIGLRMDQIIAAIREGYARIYVDMPLKR
ncbi:GntR family transcriptional regulator [Marinivivus vitaminiproducens]|uniref:GntR family transcriptional regulator n=1 Tax=Marinivivus vitaminiproducens TaxID=3035935 RepID=UPI0027A1ED03|nr:GntR family transcriptional regulator [Geminicoccaceae bacterium SCSIO 64248]